MGEHGPHVREDTAARRGGRVSGEHGQREGSQGHQGSEGHPGARGQAGGAGRTAGNAGEDLVLF